MANGPQHTAPGSARMVVVMGGVGLIASVLLVFTYQITAPYIARNRAAYLDRAIYEVLPDAVTKAVFTPTPDGRLARRQEGEADADGWRLYAGYDAEGALVGVAVEAQGQGYQDAVRLLYGYAPGCACVVGMKVLESKETPGLGDRIEKDPAFRANFEALDVQLTPDRQRLLHDVTLVKPGRKTEAWQVEAITGATISSRAVARIIQQSAAEVLPLIDRNLNQLQEAP